jgi:glucosylceramidase
MRRFLLGCLALLIYAVGSLFPIPLLPPSEVKATPVSIWETTADGQNHLTPQQAISFHSSSMQEQYDVVVDINDRVRYQQIRGFGAAMTDTSAWLIGKQLPVKQRDEVMRSLFDGRQGIGMSFVRIPMGASDFTATPPEKPRSYSYDDLPAGKTDPELAHFSTQHDEASILPLLKQAHAMNPSLTYMANPWSPPAWMKSNSSMLGSERGKFGQLLPGMQPALANYFVRFLQDYEKQGVPVTFISPENEPTYAEETFPAMYMSARDEADFIKNFLGPALVHARLTTRTLAWDSNTNDPGYPIMMLEDEGTRKYIAGVAWHCYTGGLDQMTWMHRFFPTVAQMETECSTGQNGIAPMSAIDLAISSVQNWASTVELWNIALDTKGGPKIGMGCVGCTGLVTIDQKSGHYTFTSNYYQIGHMSKFVLPGAYHISSTSSGDVTTASFENPGGGKVLVVHNTGSSYHVLKVRWNGQSFTYTLPSDAVATFTWS